VQEEQHRVGNVPALDEHTFTQGRGFPRPILIRLVEPTCSLFF
jgi:hypothetical protein